MQKVKQHAKALFMLMRPWHYFKNLLVFVPAFFGGSILESWGLALIGFLSMSLASSGIYAINDCRDAAQDRLHPEKCRRPVASGEVSQAEAAALAGLCIAASLLLLLAVSAPGISLLPLALYIAVNILYSVLGFKNIPIVDVTIVALGFVLRVLFGGLLAGVQVSDWLLLTVMMGSYYMALGKRRNELRDAKKKTRAVLAHYSYEFLDKQMYLFLTLAVAFYSLWSVDARTAPHTVLTVPLVLLLLMRYSLVVEGKSSADPIEVILHDRMLIVLAVLYAALMFALIYLQGGAAA